MDFAKRLCEFLCLAAVLGANAILAVSLAACKAGAAHKVICIQANAVTLRKCLIFSADQSFLVKLVILGHPGTINSDRSILCRQYYYKFLRVNK